MPPRADRVNAAYVELSCDERAAMDRMRAACAATSDPNLIRIALWSLADHLELEMPNGVFDLREHRGYTAVHVKNPKIRQHEPLPRAKPKKPATDHPWRGQGRLLA